MDRQYSLLIVDDEPGIRDNFSKFFAKRGFDVDTAENGLDGLQKLRSDEFDVAIIDIKMPEMDGIELARKIQEEGIDASIIILTGHGEKEDAVEAINIGVDAWFEKHKMGSVEAMDTLLAKVKAVAEVIPLDTVRKILSDIPDKDL